MKETEEEIKQDWDRKLKLELERLRARRLTEAPKREIKAEPQNTPLDIKTWKTEANIRLKGTSLRVYNKYFHRFLSIVFLINLIILGILVFFTFKYFSDIKTGITYVQSNWTVIQPYIAKYVGN